jgi:hypothetical protein
VVKLEALLLAGCVSSPHGSAALSSTSEMSSGSQTAKGASLRQPRHMSLVTAFETGGFSTPQAARADGLPS